MACMRHDVQKTNNQYLVIRKKPSDDAPFILESEKGIEIVNGDNLDLAQLKEMLNAFHPNLLYVTGWSDNRYLQIAKAYKSSGGTVITGMDNQWLGTLRQYAGALLSKWKVLPYFTHIWVPGSPQVRFAKKLGFKDTNILTGLYCADEEEFKVISQSSFERKITFVGRLVEHKGLKILFSVLNNLIDEGQLNFKVEIIGNGPLQNEIPSHSNISHVPFVTPENLPSKLENAGFFILPSIYEAWGVVVHEAALAGLPIISTKECGATTVFLEDKKNGYIYAANDAGKLKEILLKINELTEEKYFSMSKESKQLANKINLNNWSDSINSVLT